AAHGSVDHGAVRMAVGIRDHRCARVRVACRMVADVRPTRAPRAPQRGGARAYSQRSSGAAAAYTVESIDTASADLDVRGPEIHDRSDLVVVPLLDSRLLQPEV